MTSVDTTPSSFGASRHVVVVFFATIRQPRGSFPQWCRGGMLHVLWGVLVLWAVSGVAQADERGQQPPNIVFFFADDQPPSALGCYGNSLADTPTIDGLAARGTRFRQALVSQSICWVSRTSILTGRTGRSYGSPGNPELTRPEVAQQLVSDLLRQHGYRTGFFGKWHAKMPAGYKPEDHFDAFRAISRNPYYKPQPDGALRHETDLIVDEGVRFLRQHPRHQPFLLNLWFNACHAEDGDRRPGIGHYPWPQGVASLFGDTDMPPPRLSDPTIFESLPDFLKTTINRERYFWRWNTPYKYQENRRAYYRMVAGIDRAMKRILEELARLGLSENTIIVYSADNGYYLGNRGLAGKWSHYEESLHVPLIIVDPRVPKECQGQVTDAIALNLDLPATFLHWAGIDIPQSYQGHSLAPIVDGQVPRDWRTDSFHEHFAVRERIPAFEGVRTAHYKYVRYFDHGNYEFLHDLREDPDELRNLVADPRYREVLESLRERTDAYVAQYGGPLQPLETPFRSSTVPHPEAAALVGAKPDADGWVSLHDGRTLRGWVGDKRYWRVEDGAIVGRSDGSLESNTFLTWTFNTVQNFEFSVEVQISPEGNSGIQYRSHPRPDIHLHAVSGYQCDIVPNRSDYNGMIYEEGGRGMIVPAGKAMHIDASGNADQLHVLAQSAPANTTWTEYRIVAKANRLQHFVDGTLVAELIDDDPRHRRSEGVLAFQLHRGQPMEVRFRKPRLRHFPDSLPPDTPSPD